jgi:hypothetical protein
LEGTADIRVIEGILESIKSGRAVRLSRTDSIQYPATQQKIDLPAVKPSTIVNAQSPSAKQ